jgi:Rv2258c-like winged HTH domain
MDIETSVTTEQAADPAAVGQVMGQLMADLAATSGMLLTLVGVRTGLWDALAGGPASPGELAERSSAAEPYVREWLRSQAAAGYVRYEPATGRYSLPAAVAAVMAGEPLRGLVEGTGLQAAAQWAEVARYEEAFRTGHGIGWDEHGPAHSRGMDLISQAVVLPALAGWLAALDGVAARLEAGGLVADVGSGAKGLRDIATLLARPREPVPATQLAGLVAPAGADPVLDDQARAAYKARLTELDQDIDDATVGNDLERAARAAAEREALIGELTRALGLGGRSRRLSDDSERARKAVTARIHHAVDHLEHYHPALAAHLRAAIRTGAACAHQPAEYVSWNL